MAALSKKLRSVEGSTEQRLVYWCQGCEDTHQVRINAAGRPSWTWDGNAENPTFEPSVLTTQGHYVGGGKVGDSGCTCLETFEDYDFKCYRCHTFIRGGMVQFLSDCTHKFAGQTLPLPDWPYAEGEYGGV